MSISLVIFTIVYSLLSFPIQDSLAASGQILDSDRDEQGVIRLDLKEGWKYQSGDSLHWAEPEFDDSEWHEIPPGNLRPNAMADNQWNGYGWWRITFEADSSFYERIWNLYFDGWGAAEVYIDGQRVHAFGDFSDHPAAEVTYTPLLKQYPPVTLSPRERHVIAVRYSNHQAGENDEILQDHARNAGFSIGFSDGLINAENERHKQYSLTALIVAFSFLLLLFLLHVTVYFKNTADRSNAVIAVTLLLLMISCVSYFYPIFMQTDAFWAVITQFIWQGSFFIAIHLLPFVVAVCSRMIALKKSIHLVWLSVIPIFTYYIGFEYHTFYLIFLSALLIVIIGLHYSRTSRSKKDGILYIAAGAAGTLLFYIVFLLHDLGEIALSSQQYYSVFAIVYLSFPLGLIFNISNRYATNYYASSGQESEERFSELEKAYKNLQYTYDQLKSSVDEGEEQGKLSSLKQLSNHIAVRTKDPLMRISQLSNRSIALIDETRRELKSIKLTSIDDSGVEQEDDALINLLDDLESNLNKIHEHRVRIDRIVRVKVPDSLGRDTQNKSPDLEPVNLNELIKKNVRIAEQKMQNGKNPVKAEIKMDLDDHVGQVPLITEDFSKAMIHLCNHAFDAMREKLGINDTQQNESLKGGGYGLKSYSPHLIIRTRREDKRVFIKMEHNGAVMANENKEKIIEMYIAEPNKKEKKRYDGLQTVRAIVNAHGGEMLVLSFGHGTSIDIELNGVV